MTPEQQAKVKGIIDAKINNTDVKGSVAALQGKWGYLNFGGTVVDLQLLKGLEFSWQQLCFLFAVPYEFFDTRTTFTNKEFAQKFWVTDTIVPACKQFDSEMNRILLKAFKLEGIAFIASDASELTELQVDLSALIKGLETAWWITPNEKRAILNYESFEDQKFNEPWIPPELINVIDTPLKT